jgi:hypothetical protein
MAEQKDIDAVSFEEIFKNLAVDDPDQRRKMEERLKKRAAPPTMDRGNLIATMTRDKRKKECDNFSEYAIADDQTSLAMQVTDLMANPMARGMITALLAAPQNTPPPERRLTHYEETPTSEEKKEG